MEKYRNVIDLTPAEVSIDHHRFGAGEILDRSAEMVFVAVSRSNAESGPATSHDPPEA